MVTRKLAPPPGSEVTATAPSWAAAIAATIERPSPTPPLLPGAGEVGAVEAVEDPLGLVGRQAGPVVGDLDAPRRRRRAATRTVASACRAACATARCQQVVEHLAQSGAVAERRRPARPGARSGATGRPRAPSRPPRPRARRARTGSALERPALVEPGEQQQVLDERAHPLALRARSRASRARGRPAARRRRGRTAPRSARTAASGVRSSCDASATNRRSRRSEASIRSSIVFSARPSRPTSVRDSARSTRCERSPAAIRVGGPADRRRAAAARAARSRARAARSPRRTPSVTSTSIRSSRCSVLSTSLERGRDDSMSVEPGSIEARTR